MFRDGGKWSPREKKKPKKFKKNSALQKRGTPRSGVEPEETKKIFRAHKKTTTQQKVGRTLDSKV